MIYFVEDLTILRLYLHQFFYICIKQQRNFENPLISDDGVYTWNLFVNKKKKLVIQSDGDIVINCEWCV